MPQPGIIRLDLENPVIRFRGNGNREIYAQIFVSRLREASGNRRILGVVARGTEIDPVDLDEVDFDYFSHPLDHVVKRIGGRQKAYEYLHGSVNVEIVANHDTPDHGKPRTAETD
jgi:hypothetical protein